jgi:hypothetical protein
MIRTLLHSLLYFPSRAIVQTPTLAALDYRELVFETEDRERLVGWWVAARAELLGHLLLCHGNAGNVGDRVLHAEPLADRASIALPELRDATFLVAPETLARGYNEALLVFCADAGFAPRTAATLDGLRPKTAKHRSGNLDSDGWTTPGTKLRSTRPLDRAGRI